MKKRLPATANNDLSAKLEWYNSNMRVEFKESSLKQNRVTFAPRNVVYLFIAVRPVFLRRWQILPIRFLIRLFVQIITVDKNNIKL